MSKTAQRYRGAKPDNRRFDPTCKRKRRFRDEEEAKDALTRIRFQASALGLDLATAVLPWRYYLCPSCRGFHLTKMRQIPLHLAA